MDLASSQMHLAAGGGDLIGLIIFVIIAAVANAIKSKQASQSKQAQDTAPGKPKMPGKAPALTELENFLKELNSVGQEAGDSTSPAPPPLPPPAGAAQQTHRKKSHRTHPTKQRHTSFKAQERADLIQDHKAAAAAVVKQAEETAAQSFKAAFSPPPVPQVRDHGLHHEATKTMTEVIAILHHSHSIRDAVLLREVLGPPVALKQVTGLPGSIS